MHYGCLLFAFRREISASRDVDSEKKREFCCCRTVGSRLSVTFLLNIEIILYYLFCFLKRKQLECVLNCFLPIWLESASCGQSILFLHTGYTIPLTTIRRFTFCTLEGTGQRCIRLNYQSRRMGHSALYSQKLLWSGVKTDTIPDQKMSYYRLLIPLSSFALNIHQPNSPSRRYLSSCGSRALCWTVVAFLDYQT
jgi:hypothetical protein